LFASVTGTETKASLQDREAATAICLIIISLLAALPAQIRLTVTSHLSDSNGAGRFPLGISLAFYEW